MSRIKELGFYCPGQLSDGRFFVNEKLLPVDFSRALTRFVWNSLVKARYRANLVLIELYLVFRQIQTNHPISLILHGSIRRHFIT